jgi:VanZ family protein
MKAEKKRILFITLSIVWAIGIFIFSSIPGSGLPSNMGVWTIAGHFSEYFVLASLLTLVFNIKNRPAWKVAVIAVVIASLYGASDEFHQLFVEGRYCDIYDWITDTTGAIFGAIITVIFSGKRRFTTKT